MIFGDSRKKTEKNKTIKVPINKKVYTKASIFFILLKFKCLLDRNENIFSFLSFFIETKKSIKHFLYEVLFYHQFF
jgi:tryptophanase